jgi:hypothetical protein
LATRKDAHKDRSFADALSAQKKSLKWL